MIAIERRPREKVSARAETLELMGSTSTATPISIGGYVSAVSVATVIFFAGALGREIFAGNPDAGFIIIILPFALPIYCLISCAIGVLPFYLLRKLAPCESANRFAFIMLLFSPTILLIGAAGIYAVGRWQRQRFNPYPNLIHPQFPPFAVGLLKVMMEFWPMLLLVTCAGGLVCWAVDRRSSRSSGLC
jgi:hypothetical protein